MNWKSLLLGFRGRINRGKYWLAFLINIVAWLIALGAFVVGTSAGAAAVPLMLIGFAILAAMLWSSTVIAIKRLHDRNKSGWWLLLWYVLPAIVNSIGQATENSVGTLVVSLVALGLFLWGFIEIGILRGTAGANRFGPDPLAEETFANQAAG